MKPVRLCHDGPVTVYLVPDEVAANLNKYCLEFCTDWLVRSPDASKDWGGDGLCYNEADFIESLNRWVFSDPPSRPVEGLESVWDDSDLPREYRSVPFFHF